MSSEMREFREALQDCVRAMDVARDTIQPITTAQIRLHNLNPQTDKLLDDAAAKALALLARTEAGADGWPDIKPDGFDAREIAACSDIEQLRSWAGCMRRERDSWRQRAQGAELVLSETHPQDASGDAVMTGPGDHDDLPAFLEWVAGEVVRRDTRAGNFAEGLAQSLRGRAHILRIVKNDAMQAKEAK